MLHNLNYCKYYIIRNMCAVFPKGLYFEQHIALWAGTVVQQVGTTYSVEPGRKIMS